MHRLTTFISTMLKHELYELDATSEGEARVEDLFCRVRELCEMGGVRILMPAFSFLLLTDERPLCRS